MKKLATLLSIIAIAISLSGCAYRDYQKASLLMESGDYEAAQKIFAANADYKDSKERVLQCYYQLGQQKFVEENYAAAYGYFKAAETYSDAKERVYESSYRAGTQAKKEWETLVQDGIQKYQPEQLLNCMESYHAMEPFSEQILVEMDDYVCLAIDNCLAEKDYNAFLLLDSILSSLKNDAKFADIYKRLSKMQDDYSQKKVISFLSGEWVRLDTSSSSGLRIKVIQTDENTYAMILDDYWVTDDINNNATFHWDKGLLIWNDIKIAENNLILMDQMWLTSYYNLDVQAVSYHHGIALLDYDHMRIISQSNMNDDETITWEPHVKSDIYVKQCAIKEMPPLTKEDFLVEGKNDTGSTGIIDYSEQLTGDSSFFVYDGGDQIATNRGIKIGSSWDDVVVKYGHGRGNLYVEADDDLYNYLSKKNYKTQNGEMPLASLLSEQVDEYMDYHMEDSQLHLRFYFNDDVVTWIYWYYKH